MKIAGLDLSMNSSGITKFTLDENMNIIDKEHLGFSSVKKNQHKNIVCYKKDQFKDEMAKNIWFADMIDRFVSDCEYVALEGYAYAGSGNVFNIAEYTGLVKYFLYDLFGRNIRIYDIQSIKMFATTSGTANKFDMFKAFMNHENKFDISHLPQMTEDMATSKKKSGISPTSDIVDSFFICMLLLTELRLRKGLIRIKDQSEEVIRVFNRVTKAFPVNILDQDFLFKGEGQ